MPTAILAILHVVGEHHAEAVCAAALSHVASAATAQLPIKLVILHNRPGHFEKPLRGLICSHISNVVFCTYAGLVSGSARRALFGDDQDQSAASHRTVQFCAMHGADGDTASPSLTDDGTLNAHGTLNTPKLLATPRSGRMSQAHDPSKSQRFKEGVSGYIGGQGVETTELGISQCQLSDDEALRCLLGQVAVGYALRRCLKCLSYLWCHVYNDIQ
jgi:hypothetical protein